MERVRERENSEEGLEGDVCDTRRNINKEEGRGVSGRVKDSWGPKTGNECFLRYNGIREGIKRKKAGCGAVKGLF